MNIIVFGAHPDDCEFFAASSAHLMTNAGHKVKFISVTNGDAGHMELDPETLAAARLKEVEAADALIGVEWDILDHHDGRLTTDIAIREELIRHIRDFEADVVISHRPWDYHPDHRNTAALVQDSAYMVIVPNVCPDSPALTKNPVYLYLYDDCDDPIPFRPDVIVPIDDVFAGKVDVLDKMTSQLYEWLPFTFGVLDEVPSGSEERKIWLDGFLRAWLKNPFPEESRARFGREVAFTESFQVCPFGRTPSEEELRQIFPFVPEGGIRLP